MPTRPSRASLASLGEFQLIEDLRRRFGRTGRSVLRGIGDDAAIVRVPAGHDLLLTTDLLAEDIHFDLSTASYEDIGYKAGVANLSDIAAMGGTPHHLLVAAAIPAGLPPPHIQDLYRGLMNACRKHGVELVGGDTSLSRHGLFINIMLTGSIPSGRALKRDGAKAGDLLYVTGTVGDALAGLALLNGRKRSAARRQEQPRPHLERVLIDRHLRPTPRISIGRLLASRRLATAAIDVSDGLSGDLGHLCEQSRVGAEVVAAALPLSAELQAYASAHRADPIRLALTGGEDYELLFTVSPRNHDKLMRLAHETGCPISCVGTIKANTFGIRLREASGVLRALPVLSYQHFHRRRPPLS
jgi:thiamine-monophosphate kinase